MFIKCTTIITGNCDQWFSGVGKTSLTYLIAHNKPLLSPGWTVGCSVEVKLHRYKEGTQAQNTFFVELWDVGGSNNHRNTRNVFYQPTHGNILKYSEITIISLSKSRKSIRIFFVRVHYFYYVNGYFYIFRNNFGA